MQQSEAMLELTTLIKLLETGGYGQLIILAGMVHIILTNKAMHKQFVHVVEKVSEIDKHLSAQRAVDAALKDIDIKKDEQIKNLEERIRRLEMRKSG